MSATQYPPISAIDVTAAHRRIATSIRRTPTWRTTLDTRDGPVEVALKLEFTQIGGCFKVRGSLNAVMRADDALINNGVVIASGGNAAIGAAWAATIAGTRCIAVLPTHAPEVKVAALRDMGAQVHLVGTKFHDAAVAAIDIAEASGALLLHAYDLPEIVAGAGTIGLELIDEVEGPLTTVACVGGGGLLGGLAATLRPGDRLIGAEPVGASCLHQAITAGEPVDVALDSVAVDSLGATRVGGYCWSTIAGKAVSSVVVSDEDIVAARRMMWERFRIVVEHGSATAIAAVSTGQVRAARDSTLCVVLCGANSSLASL